MKISYLLVLFTIISIITSIGVCLIIENFELKEELRQKNYSKKVIAIADNQTILEKKIIEKSNNPRYKINAYYPYTSYDKLNKKIENKINREIESLKKMAQENNVMPNQYYTIDINYEHYAYKNYVSYVFYISTYTGGAHPNNIIWSIAYDIENGKIITIEDLIKENPNILKILSKESRTLLKQDKRFQDMDSVIEEMMIEGTREESANFKTFAFSEEGLILFFEQYQVAPYSYGSFEVIIPYSKII